MPPCLHLPDDSLPVIIDIDVLHRPLNGGGGMLPPPDTKPLVAFLRKDSPMTKFIRCAVLALMLTPAIAAAQDFDSGLRHPAKNLNRWDSHES